MIKATYRLTLPQTAEATLTVTMLVSEWETFLSQMRESKTATSFPTWKMVDLVADVVEKAHRVFESTDEFGG